MSLDAESERSHHGKIIRELVSHLLPIFNGSNVGVYVYLDSEHKSCNDRLADMFGYTPGQWEALYPIEQIFSKETRANVMATYYEKIIGEKAPVSVEFTGIKKDGSSFDATLLMVPISFQGLIFALCFIEPKET